MNNTNKNIIFIAGGGTGGHLFPAISIGNKLESMGLKIIYIGSKFGIFGFVNLPNFFPFRPAVSINQAAGILK